MSQNEWVLKIICRTMIINQEIKGLTLNNRFFPKNALKTFWQHIFQLIFICQKGVIDWKVVAVPIYHNVLIVSISWWLWLPYSLSFAYCHTLLYMFTIIAHDIYTFFYTWCFYTSWLVLHSITQCYAMLSMLISYFCYCYWCHL